MTLVNLKPWPEQGDASNDARIGGRGVEDEELVGRAGVDAGAHLEQVAIGLRDVAPQHAAQVGLLGGPAILSQRFGARQNAAILMRRRP